MFQDVQTSQLVHEFKSPLGAIEGAKEILTDEMKKGKPDKKKIRDHMDMIERNVQRLEGFVTEVLEFVRTGQEGGGAARPEEIDFLGVAHQAKESFPLLSPRISIRHSGPTIVRGSPEGIRQILTNLISNAGKYAPGGSFEVTIAGTAAGAVQTSVRDSGKGLTNGDLQKIFEPFVRANSGAGAPRGTGLGLTIAKAWVEAHGGKIWAESEGEGRGTKVTFTLPVS